MNFVGRVLRLVHTKEMRVGLKGKARRPRGQDIFCLRLHTYFGRGKGRSKSLTIRKYCFNQINLSVLSRLVHQSTASVFVKSMYPAANPCHHQVNPGRYLDTGSSPVKSPNLPFSRNFINYHVGNKISNYCWYKVVRCFKYILQV